MTPEQIAAEIHCQINSEACSGATCDSCRIIAAALRRQSPEAAPEQCVIGVYCRKHQFVHGAEAEELRERIERAINMTQGRTVTISTLQHILDDVDARDSCALPAAPDSTPTQETEK